MKIETGKYFVALIILALLIASLSKNSFASAQDFAARNADHNTLANEYDNSAREMQAKIQEQKDIFKNKPRTSYFGKNGQKIKSHVAYKIREYEKAAKENLKKADYHHKIAAGQTDLKSAAKVDQTNEPINKAKKELNYNKESL